VVEKGEGVLKEKGGGMGRRREERGGDLDKNQYFRRAFGVGVDKVCNFRTSIGFVLVTTAT